MTKDLLMDVTSLERGDWLEDAVRVVREAVTAFRRGGLKSEPAFEQAALALGITPGRAKCFFYRELKVVTREEHASIKQRFLAHLDAEAKVLEERSQALRLRRSQLRLELNEPWSGSCFLKSLTGGGKRR